MTHSNHLLHTLKRTLIQARILLLLLPMLTLSGLVTPVHADPIPTAAPLICDSFQISCTSGGANPPTHAPYPTTNPSYPTALPFPTVIIPTLTYIPVGMPLPPFPQIYNPATESQNGPTGLMLKSIHIKIFVWDLVKYGVQIWNYYYYVADTGAHEAMNDAVGALLLVTLIAVMMNVFTQFKKDFYKDYSKALHANKTGTSSSSSTPPDPPEVATP